jgi:uncharacterized lipoprotein YajG
MRTLASLALLVACSGCALTKAEITVPYVPAASAAPLPGVSGATTSVETTDGRTAYRDRIGVKKNGYGMEMAAIVSQNDLPTSVTDAFRQELAARGFHIAPGGADVQIELVHFFNDFKLGLFAGDAVANVAFNVKVIGRDGKISFSEYYEGNGTEPNIMVSGGDNAQAALIKAFTAAVASAVNDPAFTAAIVAAAGGAGHPVALLGS